MTGGVETSTTLSMPAQALGPAARERPGLAPAHPPRHRGGGGTTVSVVLTSTSQAARRAARPAPQELWETARSVCLRSQALIEASRATLSRHSTAIAALRSVMRTQREEAARGAARPSSGQVLALDEEIVIGRLTLLPLRTAVVGTGRPVHLTLAEWRLLVTLVQNRTEILGRSELATHAWGPAFAGRHSEVEVYISRLRRKLMQAGSRAVIRTVRGLGYRLSVDAEGTDEGCPPSVLGGSGRQV